MRSAALRVLILSIGLGVNAHADWSFLGRCLSKNCESKIERAGEQNPGRLLKEKQALIGTDRAGQQLAKDKPAISREVGVLSRTEREGQAAENSLKKARPISLPAHDNAGAGNAIGTAFANARSSLSAGKDALGRLSGRVFGKVKDEIGAARRNIEQRMAALTQKTRERFAKLNFLKRRKQNIQLASVRRAAEADRREVALVEKNAAQKTNQVEKKAQNEAKAAEASNLADKAEAAEGMQRRRTGTATRDAQNRPSGQKGISDARRLSAAEQATATRLQAQTGLVLKESHHVGAEYVDAQGRTYDALGDIRASQFWNKEKFTASISNHLLKANDFTVIDMTGFKAEQKDAISGYVKNLPEMSRNKIIKIGF